MIDVSIIINKIAELNDKLSQLRLFFKYDDKLCRLNEIAQLLANPDTWQDIATRLTLGKEQTRLTQALQAIDAITVELRDLEELLELALAEPEDYQTLLEIEKTLTVISERLAKLEFERLFNGPMDNQNVYLDIQSGSGGTEAQDWAEMLLRMYLKFGDRLGFKTELLEVSPGEVAGIKSATIKFLGSFAYGWLRTEAGVHRLVRKSPFDTNHKRHTSFASVFAYPEIDDEIKVEINPADLRIDTYRAQGAGGQHVNKTDSAVRIKHNPTGIIVQCQSERSQQQNRLNAMKQLKAKLYERELRKQQEKMSDLEATKLDITWGSQIRSYILDDSRIKDLRTNLETRNVQSVLDGNLELFIKETLKSLVQN